jgi:hypothetical protein
VIRSGTRNVLKSRIRIRIKISKHTNKMKFFLLLSFTWKYVNICIRDWLSMVVVIVVVAVKTVGHIAKELEAGAHAEQELTRRLPQPAPVLVSYNNIQT